MRKGKTQAGSGAAAAAAMAMAEALESLFSEDASPEQFCAEISQLFQVRPTEVALLRLEQGLLRFLFPPELKTSGSIPLSSASTVAAHTAASKKTELFNSFLKVKHARIFEAVKLGEEASKEPKDQLPIQKLISAPILDEQRKVLGVIQVSRKGMDVSTCGPDFTLEDLRRLEALARTLAKASFMQSAAT